MPLSPDSPNTQDVAGPVVSKNLTTIHITDFHVNINPNGVAGSKVSLQVRWSEGYMDGENYCPVNHFNERFSGQDLEDTLNENTTGGSLYGEVKAKLYAWLQSQGKAPAGTVS